MADKKLPFLQCRLETTRTRLCPWHEDNIDNENLAAAVVRVMSKDVTASLPPPWQGTFTLERAKTWIQELDDESSTMVLSIVDKTKPSPEIIGFVILFAQENAGADPLTTTTSRTQTSASFTLRLGYMQAKESWGKGFATEIIAAVVQWAKATPEVTCLIGGVARENVASQKVLMKNGFVMKEEGSNGAGNAEELEFILDACC